MHVPHVDRMLVVALVFGILPFAAGQVCRPPRGQYGYIYYARNQSSLDTIARNCTTVDGSIVIATNFTGSFYLPNVRNITGLIRDEWEIYSAGPTPTSISLPDLEFMGSDMDLQRMSSLTSVSAPNLKRAGWAISMDYVQDVDLRSLETVRYLTVAGKLSSLRLDSVRNVAGFVNICNKDRCDKRASAAGPLNISLPSLQTVGSIEVDGSLSGLALPNLTTIEGYGEFVGFRLATADGPAINLTFPRLSDVNGSMSLEGPIGSISMPEVRNVTTYFEVDAHDPLVIDLPLQEASEIYLHGAISSVKFPHLKSVSNFTVESSLSLDCGSVENAITKTTSAPRYQVHCKSDSKKSSKKLGTGAIVGIVVGVVVGVAGLAIILGVLYYLKRRKRQRKNPDSSTEPSDSSPPNHEELQGTHISPPKYTTPLGST
ncbi:uncharacterized protein BO97DRAFT_272057 [Aspergillus homomorphus CBS 101889]|uniref:Uncharacterized protein n=1 Tax=Aspergillus homomorphus (strain CBS 101889) TaxID=1450537 RepID=A0A395I2X1_ASPHC|nr:hypothetical protein BO97DRAFT_272057 [Aspergillus homomorphus CBS 101889]RAL14531.1 hypothetical protein BO97DRAFT_272057 [Aspergillus homomorphus CBS 101889]